MRRLGILGAVIGLTVALAPVPSRAAATVQVFMNSNRFCNAPVCTGNENTTVHKGDTVQWIYTDPACAALTTLGCHHTVTASSFGSGTLGPTGSLTYEHTFNTMGTFAYACAVHVASVGMKASIVVVA